MTEPAMPAGEENPGNEHSLGPVSESSRIEVMDILRGFALVGIIFMNVEWFSRSSTELGFFDTSLTGVDHAAGWLVRCFVEGKFYKLFTLLFGMGFTVMLLRAQEAGRPFAAWFSRRMAVLLLFGLGHAIFIWNGDILATYAVGGFAFLLWIHLFRKPRLRRFNNPRSFLKIGIVWLVIPVLAAGLAGMGYSLVTDNAALEENWLADVEIAQIVDEKLAEPVREVSEDAEEPLPEESNSADEDEDDSELTDEELRDKRIEDTVDRKRKREERAAKEESILSEGTYLDGTRLRLSKIPQTLGQSIAFALVIMVPICLIGYWFVVSGVLRNHHQHRALFRNMAWIGTTSGFFLSVGGLMLLQHPAAAISRSLAPIGGMLFHLSQFLMAAGYLGIVVLLADGRAMHGALAHLAPFGRMALTNYILQSVILGTLFYGVGFGLYGEVSRAMQIVLVLLIVAVQILYSKWWLTRYRFGPLEWIWRCATYKSLQPIRLRT